MILLEVRWSMLRSYRQYAISSHELICVRMYAVAYLNMYALTAPVRRALTCKAVMHASFASCKARYAAVVLLKTHSALSCFWTDAS